jgi:hypothetical protein
MPLYFRRSRGLPAGAVETVTAAAAFIAISTVEKAVEYPVLRQNVESVTKHSGTRNITANTSFCGRHLYCRHCPVLYTVVKKFLEHIP